MAAGLLAAGFAAIVGEPQVSHAISFEDQLRRLAGQPVDPVLVSRSIQSSIGMLTGMIVYGVSFGGIFAIVFGLAYGRLGPVRARGTSLCLAGAGLVAVYLVPTLKYPANPPSVGQAATLGHRTALYVDMLVLSVAAIAAAAVVGRYLVARRGVPGWDAVVWFGLAYLGVMALAMVFLPGVNEVPRSFPATVLWRFRVASAGIQVVLWTGLALVFGVLAERFLEAGASLVAPAVHRRPTEGVPRTVR